MSLQALRRAVEAAGGALEEDEPFRDMRRFQAVAPDGRRWRCSEIHALVVEWARGTSPSAQAFNRSALADVRERVRHGLEDCPADCDCRG